MKLSAYAEARQSSLDGVLVHAGEVADSVANDLFGAADVIDGSSHLRRALTDPSAELAAKQGLIARLFGGKIDATALAVVQEAVGRTWGSGRALTSAIERQGVRSVFLRTIRTGQVSAVEDELFRFSRVVESDHDLREAFGNHNIPLANREALAVDLLNAKVSDDTLALIKRAIAGRERTFALTMDRYLDIAAQLQRKVLAHVTVARPLTSEQEARLAAALNKQAGRTVVLQVTVDPSLIGGVRVELGDDRIDGTMAGRLADARQHLA